ncbi:VHS and GAT domain-containing protein [Aspergillus undulatus]|uniref:VHS and GAT domain-containing protein n=1 Tax=Aspergillus undulatus TaxID=1810928 RepID=UPI003CCDAB78
MKRLLSTINKRPSASPSRDEYAQDSPESIVLREVNAFCEEGQGPNQPQGEEFVHLPSIVEAAESSPNAAREAAHLLRKLLSSPNSTAANVQYNAIMLIRILIDNPGHSFTRNLDTKFVATIKDSLRTGKDMGVQRFLRETLDAMELQRAWDEDLKLLIEMWKKEKEKMHKAYSPKSRTSSWRGSPSRQNSSHSFPIVERTDSLPPPDELVSRISEAKTSAKLLTQFVQSTPPTEMLSNELIQEFSGRCRRASRAIQNYIHATNPPPDEDTLLTLIETSDELSVALSKHQRAVLQARKALGQPTPPAEQTSQSPSPSDQYPSTSILRPVPPPPVPQRTQTPPLIEPVSPVSPETAQPHRSNTVNTTATAPSDISTASGSGPQFGRYDEYRSEDYQVQNPFADNYSIPSIVTADERDERDRRNGTQTQTPQPVQQAGHQQHL